MASLVVPFVALAAPDLSCEPIFLTSAATASEENWVIFPEGAVVDRTVSGLLREGRLCAGLLPGLGTG